MESVEGFNAVYDGKAKVLMMGTVPSKGGVKYGFFYMSKVNKLYHYLTQVLGTDDFVSLANDYRAHYESEKRDYYLDRVKRALYDNHIALFDVIDSCERYGSADNQITQSSNHSAQSIKQILIDNPEIKMIFLNSYEVEKRFKQIFGKQGIEELKQIMKVSYTPYTRILSPSPMCKRTHSESEIIEDWKKIKQYLK